MRVAASFGISPVPPLSLKRKETSPTPINNSSTKTMGNTLSREHNSDRHPQGSKPRVFSVPSNVHQILSPLSTTPEGKVMNALMSDEASNNIVALFGMGGVGKTTILRALGNDTRIWAKFPDGVWFFHLGDNIQLPTFTKHLHAFVKSMFPDFADDFRELAIDKNMHGTMVIQLIDRLMSQRVLLLFDDVCNVNEDVYNLVCDLHVARQTAAGALKMLMSTRNWDIADFGTHILPIPIYPKHIVADINRNILYRNANITTSELVSISPQNRIALDCIIKMCAGLPLALSIAGYEVKQMKDPSVPISQQNVFIQYRDQLETNRAPLLGKQHPNGHVGLRAALKSSLVSLDKVWELKDITVEIAFQSFCILPKQKYLPVDLVRKLWGVTQSIASRGIVKFARHNLVSLVRNNGIIDGIEMHDLIHDLAVEMAESQDGAKTWHAKLIDKCRISKYPDVSDGDNSIQNLPSLSDVLNNWWSIENTDKYMVENVVHHLLGAQRGNDALELLTDYRWVESTNKDEERPPFQKYIVELQMLRKYLQKSDKETNKKLTSDIDVIMKTIDPCMVLYCMENRKECAFQLYGRLRSVEAGCVLVERLLWSVEQYGQRPLALTGDGVLTSGQSLLKRVHKVDGGTSCMSAGAAEQHVITGDNQGNLEVLNGFGESISSLAGHREDCRVVDVDQSSELIFSCNSKGCVTLWEEYKRSKSIQADSLRREERITCMQILPRLENVVLGTNEGRLLVMDIKREKTTRTVNAHVKSVKSLTTGKSQKILASASHSGILFSTTRTFQKIGLALKKHAQWVNTAVLSGDETLLASGSNDGTVRLWDVQKRKQLWQSFEQHHSCVKYVLFGRNQQSLYSVDSLGTICVWRISNGGLDVSLVSTLRHGTMRVVKSLSISEEFELFALSNRRIYVWDVRNLESENEIDTRNRQDNVFLADIEYFKFSSDERIIATWNSHRHRIELRNVDDVSVAKDDVISSFNMPNHRIGRKLIVSNDGCVMFPHFRRAQRNTFVLSRNTMHAEGAHSERLQCGLSNLEHWALLKTESNEDANWRRDCLSKIPVTDPVFGHVDRYLESQCCNRDGTIVSASAVANKIGSEPNTVKRSSSWSLLTVETSNEVWHSGRTGVLNISTSPRIFLRESLAGQSHISSKSIMYEGNGESFTIGTLERTVNSAHYCSDASRLWVSGCSGGLQHIDLIHKTTQLSREEHKIPALSEDSAGSIDDEEEDYDVFISHAGPDKSTIAEPLYDLLVALGLKVFLDKTELKPGDNAPERMINAMKNARIAVVILSPEFAARKWTMKELICFLKRYRAGGEDSVTIIPVFYRLSLEDCRDAEKLFTLKNGEGENVFIAEGFLVRMTKEKEHTIHDVWAALNALRDITGIEYIPGETSQSSAEEELERKKFIQKIANAVLERTVQWTGE